LAKFEDLYSAIADRQAAGKGPTGATVDGIRVTRMRADAISWRATHDAVRHNWSTGCLATKAHNLDANAFWSQHRRVL